MDVASGPPRSAVVLTGSPTLFFRPALALRARGLEGQGGHSVRHTWEQPADLAEAHGLPQTDRPATWQVKGGVQQLSLQDGFLLWSETQQREWNDVFNEYL